eukprot:CAMPEP_0113514268 /NCGR_PEP_ID=MMETSP0014_2-20120614/40310_1 /TAXON_ID=2857 /ORGANISM="Nitzschia sp." /LENGTH=438 /DNA_ID=CAMNT_0000410737 /DNA_START=793 /DNA_END=2109 /DNA_ORIENTATION=- /assembly_acc=CAM_ASM_000159
MKLLIATLLASVVAAQEVTLEEKWRILDTPTFEYDSLAFSMNFYVSEFIVPGQSRATLYTDGCKEEGTLLENKSYLSFANSTNGIHTDVVGTRDDYAGYCDTAGNCPITEDKEAAFYTRFAGLVFELDPATLTGDNAGEGGEILPTDNVAEVNSNPVYTEETVGNVTAQVRFCVRYSLYTGADVGNNADVEVNFLETIVTLDVDLSDGFTVDDISVAPRDRLVRTAAQSYTCEGYFCDQDEVKLTGDALGATRNQGAAIRVCVVPQLDARNDGVYMRRIDSFTWTRTVDGGDDLVQDAVQNSLAALNGLTTLRCDAGDLICNFESILFASFYATAGSVAGGGICSMQFGGNGCELAQVGTDASAADFGGTKNCAPGKEGDRRLRANRYLQNEDAATAEFDLSLDLNQGSTTLNDGAPSSASTTSMAMAVLAAGAALML